MSEPNRPVAILARLSAVPGKRDELLTALQIGVEHTADEPGTRWYVMHTDDKDDDVVWFYELYDDADAAEAHATGEGLKAMRPALAGLLAGRPELTRLTPVAGKGL